MAGKLSISMSFGGHYFCEILQARYFLGIGQQPSGLLFNHPGDCFEMFGAGTATAADHLCAGRDP